MSLWSELAKSEKILLLVAIVLFLISGFIELYYQSMFQYVFAGIGSLIFLGIWLKHAKKK